jgi:putative glycosyltransferase (TIGR04372 family)
LGIRDSAYYGDIDSHRNSPPSLYLEAVNLLLARGIPVVRMGRRVSDAFPIVHKDFLDIGFEGALDDYLDVMLWAHASIAVGDSTGLTDAVALLGGKTFCASNPMDPRAFISAGNYWFAFQELREVTTGRTLKISEVVELMNEGWNIGDEGLLSDRGLVNIRMTQSEVALATEWFLSEIEEDPISAISDQQQALMTFLARHDRGAWLHYRKDALFGIRWLSMESKIYPGCISKVL